MVVSRKNQHKKNKLKTIFSIFVGFRRRWCHWKDLNERKVLWVSKLLNSFLVP